MNKTLLSRLLACRQPLATLSLLLFGLVASGTVAAAEPAQSPLSSRTAAPPQPNVMITIDDSGSMLFDFMPEQVFKVNGYNVQIAESLSAANWPGGYPNDPMRLVTIGQNNYTYQTGDVPASKNYENLYQKKFRSPDVNAMYYNPDLRYRPWIDAANVPSEMAQATFTAAKYDPRYAANLNLNTVVNWGANTRYWCYNNYNDCQQYNVTVDFNPALVYRLNAGADPNQAGSYVRYDINGRNGDLFSPATKHANRTDCAGTKCTIDEEKQNFANWFTYYRFRQSMFKAALGRTLSDFTGKVRIGWARYHPENPGALNSTRDVQQIVKPMDAAYLASVLGNLYSINSFSGTPTRSALDQVGAFFKKAASDAENPWLTSPGTTGSGLLSCRRSVNMLMTDGYYNDAYNIAGDVDGAAGPDYAGGANPNNYSPTQYLPALPFTDPSPRSDTLADVSMQYFKTDLQTGIDNKVAPIDGDIAYWQHLTQFMVGLGVKGTLDSSTPAAKLATLKQIKAGTLSWPDPTAGSNEKIDDMWHAAVNTGGDFYSVRDVAELSSAMTDAIGRAAGADGKEGGVAVSGTTLAAGTLKLVPKYQSAVWTGDLEAYTLDANGKVVNSTPTWKASTKVPLAASRNLYTWDGAAPELFAWDSMSSANQGRVGTKDLTNYIRGDATNEGVGAPYRSRGGSMLGDFVDSPPVYVKGLVDLGYDNIRADYRTYVAQKQARSKAAVFLGGNAGILHAFDAADGTELYGYLPRVGLSNLATIAAKDYGTPDNYHRFFVDGPMIETDAYITPRGAVSAQWTNIVIGSMGAGGTGVFAIHVPTTDPTALDANALMWELSALDDNDMGYVFGEIAVGKVKSGGWKAFIGNGANSKNGKSVLMVVDLATGSIDKKLTVGTGSGGGLMGVSLLKDSTSGEVVAAYAGDLKGNLWRFDFEGGTSSDWKVGFKSQPLFTAAISGTAQPITVAPVSVVHPSGAGRVVLFGTGKLIDTVDADDKSQQTFYGAWDTTVAGASSADLTSPFTSYASHRTPLQQQVASNVAVNDITGSYFKVNATAVNWSTQLGWFMDMPFGPLQNASSPLGQRVIYPAIIVAKDYVLIQTMIPAAAAAACEVSKGVGYNYLLVAADGTAVNVPIFDTNGDGVVDDKDQIVAGYQTEADGTDKILYDANDPSKLVIENTNGYKGAKLPLKSTTIKDRVWRMIVNPPEAP